MMKMLRETCAFDLYISELSKIISYTKKIYGGFFHLFLLILTILIDVDCIESQHFERYNIELTYIEGIVYSL